MLSYASHDTVRNVSSEKLSKPLHTYLHYKYTKNYIKKNEGMFFLCLHNHIAL